jgi:hypothetical protein
MPQRRVSRRDPLEHRKPHRQQKHQKYRIQKEKFVAPLESHRKPSRRSRRNQVRGDDPCNRGHKQRKLKRTRNTGLNPGNLSDNGNGSTPCGSRNSSIRCFHKAAILF